MIYKYKQYNAAYSIRWLNKLVHWVFNFEPLNQGSLPWWLPEGIRLPARARACAVHYPRLAFGVLPCIALGTQPCSPTPGHVPGARLCFAALWLSLRDGGGMGEDWGWLYRWLEPGSQSESRASGTSSPWIQIHLARVVKAAAGLSLILSSSEQSLVHPCPLSPSPSIWNYTYILTHRLSHNVGLQAQKNEKKISFEPYLMVLSVYLCGFKTSRMYNIPWRVQTQKELAPGLKDRSWYMNTTQSHSGEKMGLALRREAGEKPIYSIEETTLFGTW